MSRPLRNWLAVICLFPLAIPAMAQKIALPPPDNDFAPGNLHPVERPISAGVSAPETGSAISWRNGPGKAEYDTGVVDWQDAPSRAWHIRHGSRFTRTTAAAAVAAETIGMNAVAAQTAGHTSPVAAAIGGGPSAASSPQHRARGSVSTINDPVAGTRNWYEQPGGNGSAWNTPFGSEATWGAATDADTIDIARGWNGTNYIQGPYGNINATGHWGFTLWIGHPSDPTYRITYDNGRTKGADSASGNVTETIHIPNGAYAPGPYPGDNSFGVMDVAAVRMYGFGLPVKPPGLSGGGSYQDGLGEWDDPTSDEMGHDWDTGLSGYVVALGAINYCDVNPSCNPFYPKIKHALRYSTDAHLLKSCTTDRSMACPGTSWPQRLQDYQAGVTYYTGNLVAGTTLGIPMTTPMPGGLDANCQGAFWTFQHYPLFFRDQAGGGFNLTADQVADTSPYVASLRRCLPQLVSLLRPLRNQHVGGQSFSRSPINGPGTRVDTGPHPLVGSGIHDNHHR